jgi:molybdopterin-dependent oxidoreductase alpha subunit
MSSWQIDWKSFNPLGWKPQHWASLVPLGLNVPHPNNYVELWRALGENRDALGYAWRILTTGVCDGCALGTSGLRDWTLAGPHLCNIRLRLLRLNTMPAIDAAKLANIAALPKNSAELRQLGRLSQPMLREGNEPGFRMISWEEALGRIAQSFQTPDRWGFYVTSRGMPNESYYAIQKAVRALGSNSIDNAARVCHAPSGVALKQMIGVAATTCSYSDWIGSDAVVFIGSNVANNQPVATKYLHYAKAAGTQVYCVNTYIEPGMEQYWVPSIPESALFGSKITDRFYLINTGGDAAFLTGVLKHIIQCGLEDREFIAAHTEGFAAVKAHVLALSWEHLEQQAGTKRTEMQALGQQLGEAKTAVLVWSMGITQHARGEDNVRAIVNIALARGFLGRDKCGLMPIRGHSGVQGGAEMGCYSTALPGGKPVTEENLAALAQHYGFALPRSPGMTTPEMFDAAEAGTLEGLWSIGGNFLEVLPDPTLVEQSLGNIPLRVHQDIVLSSQMLVPGQQVIVLPAMTRYEIPGGITETSTERRVIFSPEIAGPRIGSAKPEFMVFTELLRLLRPEIATKAGFESTQAIRNEIAQVVPFYAGIEVLAKAGDQFQYGGAHLCADGDFATPNGLGQFITVPIIDNSIPAGMFKLSTRRGKQFNSMIHEKKDSLNGAMREAILMSAEDARNNSLRDGQSLRLVSEYGHYQGIVLVAPIKPGNIQVHWPEGNVLLDAKKRSQESHVPDYNTLVWIEAIKATAAV